jgi:hypothetical protein
LERRITELTSNNDANTKLAQALARLDEIEQENKELRSRINTTINAMVEGQCKFYFFLYADRKHLHLDNYLFFYDLA